MYIKNLKTAIIVNVFALCLSAYVYPFGPLIFQNYVWNIWSLCGTLWHFGHNTRARDSSSVQLIVSLMCCAVAGPRMSGFFSESESTASLVSRSVKLRCLTQCVRESSCTSVKLTPDGTCQLLTTDRNNDLTEGDYNLLHHY